MRPETEDALADAIKGAKAPLAVVGGGTRGLPVPGEALHTTGLSGITLYEPGALTLVAQAGTPVAEIEAAVQAENQRLAFEPVDYRALMGTSGAPTIGGVVATNNAGPRRIQVGAARDFALGVRYVDGAGRVVKNGGRVMKNVTGYDLVKLMSGSWGTLGVMTEVALKVLPAPEAQATVVLTGLSPEDAVTAMARALGSPLDVSGAACSGDKTYLRVEGFESSVTYRAQALQTILHDAGFSSEVDTAQTQDMWRDIRDVTAFHGAEGDVWRVSVKPSDGPRVVAAAGAEDMVMDWAGGLVWLRMAPGTDLRARLQGIAGHATLVRGTSFARFHPEPAPIAAISQGLRAQFDPKGLLNQGVMAA